MTLLAAHWRAAAVWAGLLNLTAFCLMGIDKRRAQRKMWRVPEKTFFLLALLGGAPGAIAGMWQFRHKTRHWYFKYGLPAIVILQMGLIGLLVWWSGS